MASSQDFIINFVTNSSGITIAKTQVDSLKNALDALGLSGANSSRVLSTSMTQMGGTVSAVRVQWLGMNNEINNSTVKFNAAGQAGKILTQTYQENANAVGATGKAHLSLADNVARLAERAIITIPVWMALRTAFEGTIHIFEESTKSIVDMDEALKHLQMQLVGVAGASEIINKVKQNAQTLSTQTGETPASLIGVYNQLVTVGFSVEDAFKGMDTAAKGALATNSDSKDIAGVLVNVYKELGSTITAVHTPAEKLNYIMDTMTVLMAKNHLSIADFEASLKSFAGQAEASNLTLDQTLSLIAASANVSQVGLGGGRQLTGAFRQLTLQRGNVEDFLGHDTHQEADFDVFMEALTKASDALKAGKNIPDEISQIFSLRGGGQTVRALAADIEHFKDNLKLLNSLSPDDRQAVFMGRLSIAMAELKHEGEMAQRSIEMLGRSFIEGLAGTDDFSEALKNINKSLSSMGDGAKEFGGFVGDLGKAFLVAVPTAYALATAITAINAAIAARTAAAGLALTGAALGYGAAGYASAGGGLAALAGGSAVLPGLATLGAVGYINEKAKQDIRDSKAGSDALADLERQQIAQFNIERQRRGLKPIPGTQFAIPPNSEVPGTGPKSTKTDADDFTKQQQKLNDKLKEKILDEQMLSLGYNNLEILDNEIKKIQAREYSSENAVDLAKAKLEYEIAYNKEIAKSSEALQKSFSTNLSDIFQHKTSLPTAISNISKEAFGGVSDAFAGNFTEQIFKGTGIGDMFGGLTTGIRHANDDPTGIKAGGDYAAQKIKEGMEEASDNFTKKVSDYTAADGTMGIRLDAFKGSSSPIAKGLSVLGGDSGAQSSFAGATGWGKALTLPGFGQGGFFNRTIPGGAGYNTSGLTFSAGGPISNTSPFAATGGGATYGQALGAGAGALSLGYGAYQSAGGQQGSLSIPAGIFGTLGGLALAGSAGMFGAAGAGLGAMTGLSALAPALGPIGIGLMVGALLFSAFSTTKQHSTQTQTQTQQVSSKIDVTNKQLQLVNRNLTAIKSSLDTYIMPGSAYFSTKTNLEDQFSVDSRRA